MPLTPFDELPAEIQLEIYEHVNVTGLHALSTCSKKTHQLAESILYSCKKSLWSSQSQGSFFRTVVARPELIRYVHRFECVVLYNKEDAKTNEKFYPTDFGGIDLSDLKESEKMWIREHLPEGMFGKEFCNGWLEEMFSPTNWDAVVAFELCLFSKNLSHLWIGQYGRLRKYPYLHSVLKQARLCPELCPNLRKITVRYSEAQKCRGLHLIVPFLKIRSVTIFNSERISERGLHHNSRHTNALYTGRLKPSNFDHVTQLNLSSEDLSSVSLEQLLLSFRNLQRFTYTHFTTVLEQSRILYSFPGIRHRLETSKDSLEKLVIKSGFKYRNNPNGLDALEPLGSLIAFKKLAKIEADATVLIGWEHQPLNPFEYEPGTRNLKPWLYQPEQINSFVHALPSCLVQLTITDCKDTVFDCLGPLFEAVPVQLAALKSICLMFPFNSQKPDVDWNSWQELSCSKRVLLRWGCRFTEPSTSLSGWAVHPTRWIAWQEVEE